MSGSGVAGVAPVGAGERYAAQPSGEEPRGWAYAVELVGRERARRFHDTEALSQLLLRWRRARKEGGDELVFSGLPDDDGEAAATYAGAVLASQVVGLRYWSPQDDRASDGAYEAVGLLVGAVNQALASAVAGAAGGAIRGGGGGLKL